ncbi:MAG: helix-turn-helix transcriptional regulator [Nocardioidaceae bacterium]
MNPPRVPEDLLPHLRRARDLADRNYAEPLNLTALADTAGVSKHHFLRCFATEYGETPMQYLGRRRIERAQDLLRATNLTVTEVCHLVGFTSLGSFSSRFRELVGSSPSSYQRTHSAAPHIPGCYIFMLGLQAEPGRGMLRADHRGGGAMQIEIAENEAAVLRDVLTTWLGDVSTEIRHTDSPAVRNGLRERRDCIRRVHDRLKVAEPAG